MSKIIGLTTDGRDIIRHDPSDGCRWRCTTCDNFLRGRSEVRAHWALHNEGHSLFEKLTTGQLYHQTIEGLYRRNWAPQAEANQPAAVTHVTPPAWAFEIGGRFLLGAEGAEHTIGARGVQHGMKTYLLVGKVRGRISLRTESEETLEMTDLPDTNQMMTPSHPRWQEFFNRLCGPEGCDFKNNPDPSQIKWNCTGGRECPKARAILTTMDFDEGWIEASILWFAKQGADCDCEILFNIEDVTGEGN